MPEKKDPPGWAERLRKEMGSTLPKHLGDRVTESARRSLEEVRRREVRRRTACDSCG
jgi:hypothetical protein